MMLYSRFAILILFLYFSLSIQAQYTFFKEHEGFAIEVSLPNSKLVRLPEYRNAISTLAVTGDIITGGTTASEKLSPFIFTASMSKKDMIAVKDLSSVIPGQRAIPTGFHKSKTKSLYAGTVANKINDSIYGSGHLIRVDVNGGKIQIADLGMPVKNEGIYSLTIDTNANVLYGLSFPSGIFFSYNITTRAVSTYRDVMPSEKDLSVMHEFSTGPENYISRALVTDEKGRVFGSRPVNKMFMFDPAAKTFTDLPDPLPDVWGRRSLGQVDALIRTKEGKIFGANAGDGQLFELNTNTLKIKNLGKPIMMPRLRGLAVGADKKLYGIAGAPPGYAHFFSYDAVNEGFADYGNPQFTMTAPGIEQGIEWRGFRLGSIAASEDGKYIVLGEDDSLSQLLIYPVAN